MALETLFHPRSIAVIGASADLDRIGGRPLRYLIEGGFSGDVYPVNRSRTDVQGLRAYPTVRSIPGHVDCAVVAVPADDVLVVAAECAAAGVGNLVVFSAGFAEAAGVGKARQAELVAIARSAGMRVLGPNCLGAYNLPNNLFLTFSGIYADVLGKQGRLAWSVRAADIRAKSSRPHRSAAWCSVDGSRRETRPISSSARCSARWSQAQRSTLP